MQHRSLDDLQRIADTMSADSAAMPRRQRLERWASVLEQNPARPVALFRQVEYLSYSKRCGIRVDNSPLMLAFGDPVLEHAGLQSDLLGEGERFFGLSERQAHYLLCDCHYQGTATAGQIAARVRAVARQRTLGERWTALRSFVARAWPLAA